LNKPLGRWVVIGIKFNSVVEGSLILIRPDWFKATGTMGISTLIAGSVLRQNDITEMQIKNTLIPATTCEENMQS
jgi:hypothetical protein